MELMTNPLPRLSIFYPSHHLGKDAKGNFKWIGEVIEVEVVTIHLRTNMMRVRSVQNIAWDSKEKPQTKSFEVSADEFFKVYELVKK